MLGDFQGAALPAGGDEDQVMAVTVQRAAVRVQRGGRGLQRDREVALAEKKQGRDHGPIVHMAIGFEPQGAKQVRREGGLDRARGVHV